MLKQKKASLPKLTIKARLVQLTLSGDEENPPE